MGSKKTPVAASIAEIREKHGLLSMDRHRIMRVPLLVKGRLRVPELVDIKKIKAAFAAKQKTQSLSHPAPTHVYLENVQVLREPLVDRQRLSPTGEYAYSVLPRFTAAEVMEYDLSRLAEGLYALPFSAVTDFVGALREAMRQSSGCIADIRDITRQTAELPDFWHDAGFLAFDPLLDPEGIRLMADHDLCAWGIPGTHFLDGWVDLPGAPVTPAPVQILADSIFGGQGHAWKPRVPQMRAMPTRQLHITAGNAPQIPFFSALRAIATKSAAVIKSPYGATMPGAILALAALAAMPEHPITQNLSIVYWPGGDESIEAPFFSPGAFDRIIVWGAPEAVASVKQRAVLSKVLTFNPRYGVSFIGREAFKEKDLLPIAIKAARDSLVANQKACIASQIHYVEGTPEQAGRYAGVLQKVLAGFDQAAPNYIAPQVKGDILRLQRGVLVDGDWYVNKRDGFFCSGVVVAAREFPLTSLTMSRMIVVRPVQDLAEALTYLHHGVSTVSLYPSSRRLALRDRIAARGVSNLLDLGQSGSGFAGQSHDGMMVLTELVDWKNG